MTMTWEEKTTAASLIAHVALERRAKRSDPRSLSHACRVAARMGTAICALRNYHDGKGGVVIVSLWKEGAPEDTAS